MATQTFTVQNVDMGGLRARVYFWNSLANGDDGTPVEASGTFPDKSIQVLGTFGAGGTIILEGSNLPNNSAWATLNDPQGNALSFTAANLEQVLEQTRWVRPRVTAGDGTTSLQAYLFVTTVGRG